MKIFEGQTQVKANGEHRLLVVDGHNSHYTVAFLLLARLHQIIVICYPAHGTHIYQGLDVVIFAILKLLLSKERDKLLRDTGTAITKSNFLSVITTAYVQALTPGNIKTAFRKTGIHPFNPDVGQNSRVSRSLQICSLQVRRPPLRQTCLSKLPMQQRFLQTCCAGFKI
jgi:hypothetical protein